MVGEDYGGALCAGCEDFVLLLDRFRIVKGCRLTCDISPVKYRSALTFLNMLAPVQLAR